MGATPEPGPQRTCVGCGARRPQARLLRFRVAAGAWTVGGQSGRSLYACPDPRCIVVGLRRGGFARVRPGRAPHLDRAEGLRLAAGALVTKAARLLGLGVRARSVAVGRGAVSIAVARRRACALVLADDAGQDARAWVAARSEGDIPVVGFPSKARLGVALGRGEAALAGVCDPSLAAGVIAYLQAAGRMAEDAGPSPGSGASSPGPRGRGGSRGGG